MKMKKTLHNLNEGFPVATVSYLAGVVLVGIAYVKGDVPVEAALVYLGGGGTAVGWVRNKAGKGLNRRV